MSATVTRAIRQVVAGRSLGGGEAYAVAGAIMEGEATPAQIAGLLVALRIRGETVEEIGGFARAMRDRADRIEPRTDAVVDTCGTGGDGCGTFNISTVVAFVAAGAGCRVAKHGNRSVSSRCGSVELLEALGVDPAAGPEDAARCLDDTGLCFLFAPRYHRATRHAVGPRREIGVRSIFNAVGPLTNPAGAKRQLLGVYDGRLTEPLAEVLRDLGSTHCMVVHGHDGLDEISLSGPTRVSELRGGNVETYDLDPTRLGMPTRSLDKIRGGDPQTNARIALDVLEGKPGPAREIVLLNAAAVLYVAGVAPSIEQGLAGAAASIDGGSALARLQTLQHGTPSHA